MADSGIRQVRIGMIGFGMIGRVHAYAWRSQPFFYPDLPVRGRITHVVTSTLETAERARRQLDADVAATDFRCVTENPEIDIVHICTPNHLHATALLSAMHAGKAIYCDKPLVATSDEADWIESALSGYHATAQMTFQTRFVGAVRRAKELLEAGRVGRILSFRFAYLHGGNASPDTPMRWKLSAESGGGVIADLASHVLDLAEYLMGPVTSLTAKSAVAYASRPDGAASGQRVAVDTEDHVCALARLSDGGLGTLEATKLATGTEDDLRFEIHGTCGAVRFSLMDPHFVEYFDASVSESVYGGDRGWTRIASGRRWKSPAMAFPSTKSATGWLEGHILCLGNFVESYLAGRPAEPGISQGIRVMRLMDAMRRSVAEGRWIDTTDEH